MKKILLIINPISGKKIYTKILPKIKEILKKQLFDLNIIESKYKGHIEKIVLTKEIKKFYCITIMGGDGSLHEAINGMMKRQDNTKIPLSIIPCGSGNSLCRDLNMLNPLESIQAITNDKKINIDILKITDYDDNIIYSFNIVGWGMVADIGIKAEKFRWLGTSRYTILSLFEILFKKINLANIQYTNKNNKNIELNDEFMFIMLANTIHTGKGMKIAPKAKLDDGLIDLLLIKNLSRMKLLKLMPQLFTGNHINDTNVVYEQIKKVYLIPKNKKNKLNIDGEIKGIAPFKLEIVPQAIQILN